MRTIHTRLLAGAFVAASICALTACSGGSQSSVARTTFKTQEVVDKDHGNLVAVRYAVPEGWKAEGTVEWKYSDLYTPVRGHARAEAPDGSAWLETFPNELFYWMDPRWDNFKQGPGKIGGIHYTDVQVQEAMKRYIINRYRGNVQKLQIVGSRPIADLGKALKQPTVTGDGIDFRLHYEVNGEPVDEEIFGILTPKLTIPYHGPQGTTYEYHRSLGMVHAIGAKQGKLEQYRPILGYMAGSFVVDKAWEQQRDATLKQMNDAFQRSLAAGYAQIAAAGALSRQISAQSDAFIRGIESQRAASNATSSSGSSSASAYNPNDGFDGYIRGTEQVTDSSGTQTEVTNAYSYHWTDGFGTVVHSNDPNYDPNATSKVPFEQMKPVH